MTCTDVEQLLGAFVDTELPPPRLLDVARHAATCSACDGAIRELTELRASVAALLESETRQLDLSGVWPAVDAAIARQAPARPRLTALRGGGAPGATRIWAALMAIAATALLWFRPATHQQPEKMIASAGRAARTLNDANIDRIAGRGITMRREPKSGTMIIWVSGTAGEGAR
jgi:anti-sigma factor RsiW